MADASNDDVQPNRENLVLVNRGSPPMGTPDWISTFLDAIQAGSTVAAAAREAGVHGSVPYQRRRYDPAFRRAWQRAAQLGTELLEAEAVRRAVHGTEEPVYYKGSQCGTVRRYSDTLLIFLLKARRPEVYREDRSGGKGSTVNISLQTNASAVQLLNTMPLGELGLDAPIHALPECSDGPVSLGMDGAIHARTEASDSPLTPGMPGPIHSPSEASDPPVSLGLDGPDHSITFG